MGHAAANNHHAARDDVCADHRAKDADEQAAKEGISEKLVCYYVCHSAFKVR